MKNNLYSQLNDNFKELGLSQIPLHLEEITDDITSNRISITEGLLRLTNYEIDFKTKSAAMSLVKVAAFSLHKGTKGFQFRFSAGSHLAENRNQNPSVPLYKEKLQLLPGSLRQTLS